MEKIKVVLTEDDFNKFRNGIDIIEKRINDKIILIEFNEV